MTQTHRLGRRKVLQSGAALSVFLMGFRADAADAYPDKPIGLINAFQPGGASDVFFRGMCKLAEKSLPHPFLIEYRPGAGGSLAARQVSKAKPDGYTLLKFTSTLIRAPYVMEAGYHPVRDFTYVIGMADVPFYFIVPANSPFKTVPELIAAAKARPGQINYSSPGVGTAPHTALEELALRYGVKLNHVAYKGAEYWQAVGGGHVDFTLDGGGAAAGLVDAGRVRILASVTSSRMRRWPSVPTLAEQGVELTIESRFGIVGPAGLPANVVQVLHEAFQKAMSDPGYEQLLDQLGLARWYAGPAQFDTWARGNFAKEGELLARLGLATQQLK